MPDLPPSNATRAPVRLVPPDEQAAGELHHAEGRSSSYDAGVIAAGVAVGIWIAHAGLWVWGAFL